MLRMQKAVRELENHLAEFDAACVAQMKREFVEVATHDVSKWGEFRAISDSDSDLIRTRFRFKADSLPI